VNETFEHIFEKSGRCESIFIAGGSVVDLEKAGDIDIWFGGNKEALALKFLGMFPMWFKHQVEGYPGAGSDWKVIGSGWDPAINKIVQVMTAPHTDSRKVLEDFDISTHQWAYTSRGALIAIKQTTSPAEPPKILKWTSKTFERYVKICKRYGHPVDMEQLKPYQTVEGEKKKKKLPITTGQSLLQYLKSPYSSSNFSIVTPYIDEESPF
jgi:hypothetical protein